MSDVSDTQDAPAAPPASDPVPTATTRPAPADVAEPVAEPVEKSRAEPVEKSRAEDIEEGRAEDLTEDQMSFLITESEHFFRGELAHEQRASWLLGLASGLLLALWRLLGSASFQEAGNLAFGLLLTTFITLSCAIGLSLWALWPLAGGKHPRQLEPWGRDRDNRQPRRGLPPVPKRLRGPIGPTLWNHYLGHRRRAEVKGRRVVRINIALFVSLFLGSAGILATLFEV